MKVVRLRAFNYLLAVAIASGLLCVAIVAFSRPVARIASTLPDRVERPCAPVGDSAAISWYWVKAMQPTMERAAMRRQKLSTISIRGLEDAFRQSTLYLALTAAALRS